MLKCVLSVRIKIYIYEGQNGTGPKCPVPIMFHFFPICLFVGFGSRAKNKVINESCFVLNL